MSLTLIAVIFVFLFLVMGFLRGILSMGTDFCAFIVAGLTAGFFSPLFLTLIQEITIVPKTLKPLSALILSGIFIFLFLSIISRIILHYIKKNRMSKAEEVHKKWERLGGALLSGVWGFCLVIIVFTGLLVIGNIEESIIKSAEKINRGYPYNKKQTMDRKELTFSNYNKKFGKIKNKVESSPLGAVARKLNPLDNEVTQMFEDLLVILSNPFLFDKFK